MKKLSAIIVLITAFLVPVFAAEEEITTVCASHILVPTELEAIKLKNDIKTYEDFQTFARQYSKCPSGQNGGKLGCFGRGQMVKPFEDAAFGGNVGEVSNPVQTDFGYHLIWVTEKY